MSSSGLMDKATIRNLSNRLQVTVYDKITVFDLKRKKPKKVLLAGEMRFTESLLAKPQSYVETEL